MKRNLIICNRCEKGRVLGELFPSGVVAVMRQRGQVMNMDNYTLISGNDFNIMCGSCRGYISIKKERRQDEITREWITRVFRQSLNGQTQVVGTYSGTN